MSHTCSKLLVRQGHVIKHQYSCMPWPLGSEQNYISIFLQCTDTFPKSLEIMQNILSHMFDILIG